MRQGVTTCVPYLAASFVTSDLMRFSLRAFKVERTMVRSRWSSQEDSRFVPQCVRVDVGTGGGCVALVAVVAGALPSWE